MARSFTATTDRIYGGTAAIPTTGSVALWHYPTWSQLDFIDHVIWAGHYDNGVPELVAIQHYTDNQLYCGWYKGGEHRVIVNGGAYTLNINAWNHWALTWDDSANVTILYLNGQSIGTQSATLTTFTTTHAHCLGNYTNENGGNADARGELGEYGLWSAVLDAAEIAALNAGFSPLLIRRPSLVEYRPLMGRDSTEPDLLTGVNSTVSGASAADHCRVIQPMPVFVPSLASAGASLSGPVWGEILRSRVFGGVAVG